MSGCMRDASDSRLNTESGEGKVRALVDKSASICSIEDCMMFSSRPKRLATLLIGRSQALDIDSIYLTYPVELLWAVDAADREDKGSNPRVLR